MNAKQNESKTFQIVPQNSNKCVWVEAGIVSYKICDRNFECETCPLELGLRGEKNGSLKHSNNEGQRFVDHTTKEGSTCTKPDSSYERLLKFKLDEHRYVNPGHSWIKLLSQNQVKIGIDDIVATAFGAIDEVIMPLPGGKVKRGASCGQVIQFEHIFSIVSPVSGEVLEINEELIKFPNQLTIDPLNKGWMMVIKSNNLEQDLKLCRSGDALMSWYLKEFKWFECHLAKGFNQQCEQVGITLTDGGEISRNLRNHLPMDQYRQMIISLLGLPDSSDSRSEDY